MKSVLLSFLLFCVVVSGFTQKLSETFNPLIKETAGIKIIQHPDGNYLVYGHFNYYKDKHVGSLIKVDGSGKLIETFSEVFTDQPIKKVIILSSEKILIHGDFKHVNGARVGNIVLLNADGSVEPAFNTYAIPTARFVIPQSTGKIIAIVDWGTYPEILRLNDDGSRDYSFSTNYSGYITDAILGENDKIYITDNWVIRRILPDGQLDNSYTITSEPTRAFYKLVVQQDGKIVAAVSKVISNTPYIFGHTLQRFDANGSIDPNFNAQWATQAISDFIIRKNGKIAVTGYFYEFGSVAGNTVELNADGSTNRALVNSDHNGMYSVYEDRNENIFNTGPFMKVNTISQKNIAKIKPNYEVDASFKLPVFSTAGNSPYVPLAIQSTGKILVGGSYSFAGAENDSSKIVRLLPSGEHDSSFKPALRNSAQNYNHPSVNAIAVQEDDKIIVGGVSIFDGSQQAFGRLLPNGALDNTFQIGSGPARADNSPVSVQLIKVHNSKIFVFGSFDRFNGQACQYFAILDKDGNKIGPAQNALPVNTYFQDFEFQADGKIVLMGTFALSPTDNRKFLRLNPDGSIDNSFKLHNLNGNPIDMAVDSKDNILVTGNYLDFDIYKILCRYKPNGDPDPTLDLGIGFGYQGLDVFTGYIVKPLHDDLIAVGGYLLGYEYESSPGLVLLKGDGEMVPFSNPFDSLSYPIVATYQNKCLYMVGRFSKSKGQEVTSAAKMLFPIDQITNFKAAATSPSSLNLTWDGRFAGAEKIIVESYSTGSSSFHELTTLTPYTDEYVVNNLDDATPYHFRVRGQNEFYSSPYFEAKDTTFISPEVALPASEFTPDSFVANWQYLPGTDSVLLQVGSNNFTEFVSGYQNLIVKGGSKTVTGLEEGKLYQYRVKRFKNKKASDFSESISVNFITEIEDSPLGVKVYPNPVSDYLKIELPENVTAAHATIHTMRGETMVQYDSITRESSLINLENFPHGIFILTVKANGQSKRFKLVRSE